MKKWMLIAGFLVVAGIIAAPVLAGWGPGRGWGGNGYGPCWSGYQGDDGSAALTEEQAAALDKLNQKFGDETAAIRSDLWAKRGELNALLSSPTPDEAKVKELQTQVSDLRSKLDQLNVEYSLEAKKIAPNADLNTGGPRYGRGGGRGGYGPGMMYGYGGRGYGRGPGYGPCWN